MDARERSDEPEDATLEESPGEPASPDVHANGTILGDRYRVLGVLGRGGMGEVYAAVDLERDEAPVAIKVLRDALASRPSAVARFEREAKGLAELSSEHVVRHQGFGRTMTGAPYLVLERLEGEDLRQVLDRRGPLPVVEALRHAHQAALGLREAHRAGLVHRDIKPSNLFLARTGTQGEAIVKLVDFGIARRADSQDTSLTSTGEALGSPRYMSPEQVRNARDVDPRTDLWSLGVTLYELLTGALPFEGTTASAVSAAIVADPPIPPRTRVPTIPREVERVVLACLEKDPASRYASAAELAADLASAAAHAGESTSLTGEARPASPPRTKLVLGAAALALFGAVALYAARSEPTSVAGATSSARLEAEIVGRAGADATTRPDARVEAAPATPLPTVSASAASPATATPREPSARTSSRPASATASASAAKPSALTAGPLDDRK